MQKLIIIVLAIAVIIGVVVFIKDKRIKDSLSGIERSEFVESDGIQNSNDVASEVSLVKKDGQWSSNHTGEYTVDASSLKFEFTGYKIGGEHTGSFNNMTATLALDAKGQPVALGIIIDPTSVKTDSEGLDKHLQAPEFFDSATYPEMKVVVKGVEIGGSTGAKAVTDITIKGVTKTLAIPVSMAQVEGGMKFDIDTKIKISEWNMSYGPVQDDVRVVLSGVLKKS